MKKNLSRIAVLLLALVMVLTSAMAAFAVDEVDAGNSGSDVNNITADGGADNEEETADTDIVTDPVTDPDTEPETYKVTWMNGSDVLKTDEILVGEEPVYPEYTGDTPVRASDSSYNYTFIGWAASQDAGAGDVITEFPELTGDMVYYAVFSKTEIPKPVYYTVTFSDGLGKTLKTQKVERGHAATAPAKPSRSGYTFTGWDKSFSNVTQNMTVTAQWKKNPHVHKYGGWTVTVKPTYFKAGQRVRKCSCGLTQKETLAKLTAKNKWVSSGGKLYYFGSDGKVYKGWHKMKPYKSSTVRWCWFSKSGIYIKSISKNTKKKWVKAGGYKFYFTKKKKPIGKGFNFINGKLYYMDAYGAVTYGTFKASDGHTYTTAKDGTISGLTYYKYKYKTFILVDISQQTLWFYKNGKLNLKADVVTGTKGVHNTPTGTYRIRSKSRNIWLNGPTWSSHVDYWMAFIGSSYGMHDASWRTSRQFSNHRTYINNGSHGCINMRHKDAAKLYSRAKTGTKVIIQK